MEVGVHGRIAQCSILASSTKHLVDTRAVKFHVIFLNADQGCDSTGGIVTGERLAPPLHQVAQVAGRVPAAVWGRAMVLPPSARCTRRRPPAEAGRCSCNSRNGSAPAASMVEENSPRRYKRRGRAPRRAWASHKRLLPLSGSLGQLLKHFARLHQPSPCPPTLAVSAGRIAKCCQRESPRRLRTAEQRQWPATAPPDALHHSICYQ